MDGNKPIILTIELAITLNYYLVGFVTQDLATLFKIKTKKSLLFMFLDNTNEKDREF